MKNPNKFSLINPKKFPFFYGYIVLVFGSIGILFSIPGQTVGVSVFTDPIKDALGLDRNQFSNAYMVGTLLSAFFITKAGFLFDRFGARIVALTATLGLSLAVFLMSFSTKINQFVFSIINTSSWVLTFILLSLLFFLLRFFGQGVLTMASRNMVMMWFNKNRGKINSISSITISLGFSSAPLLLNYLNDAYGWQMSWQILGFTLLIFSILILQFYRNKPEDFGLFPDGVSKETTLKREAKEEESFTLKQAKKTRVFWMFALALSFNSFFFTGFTFHVVSIFKEQLFTKNEAIAIFLPISIVAIIISTAGNILSDYVNHKIYLFLMVFSGLLASLGLLYLSNNYGVYLLVIGLGAFAGLFGVVNAVTWPKYYGRKFLGSITGKVTSFLVIASAIAPSLFSYFFTLLGSYGKISYLTIPYLLFIFFGSLSMKKPSM
jgi:sugar phosphate permease